MLPGRWQLASGSWTGDAGGDGGADRGRRGDSCPPEMGTGLPVPAPPMGALRHCGPGRGPPRPPRGNRRQPGARRAGSRRASPAPTRSCSPWAAACAPLGPPPGCSTGDRRGLWLCPPGDLGPPPTTGVSFPFLFPTFYFFFLSSLPSPSLPPSSLAKLLDHPSWATWDPHASASLCSKITGIGLRTPSVITYSSRALSLHHRCCLPLPYIAKSCPPQDQLPCTPLLCPLLVVPSPSPA